MESWGKFSIWPPHFQVLLSHSGQINPSEILSHLSPSKSSDGFLSSLRLKSTLPLLLWVFTVWTLIQTLSNFYLTTSRTLIKQGCLVFTRDYICESFLFSTGHVGPLLPSRPCPTSSPLKFGTSEPHFPQLAGGFWWGLSAHNQPSRKQLWRRRG